MDDQLKSQKSKVKSQKSKALFTLLPLLFNFSFLIFNCSAQNYTRADTIPVKVNSNFIKNPWAGGHNACQFSDIDLNFDGIKDLFVFDRTGDRVTTYLNGGTPNTVDYKHAPQYESKFPHMEDWALLVDYNCDGKEDIFTYAISVAGIKVWKNTSSGGNLQFTLETAYIKSDYTPLITTDPLANLYVTRVDVPALEDIDNDGDLDVITFDYGSVGVEYHINKSVELSYPCDSLTFILDPNGCWGNFQEDQNNCTINLSSCRMMQGGKAAQHPLIPSEEDKDRHAGSCSLCLDLDGDSDKEILIGDIGCCNIKMLMNTGSPASADMTSYDTLFPAYNVPVNIMIFPCGYFLDVDNDNKRDLLFSPNAENASINQTSIWFYKNTGTDSVPVFSRIQKDFLQNEMIERGAGADPVFLDFNFDGLTDLLVSNYSAVDDSCPAPVVENYNVHLYKNIGTPSSPLFELINTDFANLSTQLPGMYSKHLTFGDLNNDGAIDMMVGDFNGYIHYFQNTAGAGNPVAFASPVMNYMHNGSAPIDVGSFATPQLIDADRDGDLDLIIGERAGNLNYFPNVGTPSLPSFDLATSTINFGGVDTYKPCCTGYSVPFMFDSAGSYRMIVGSEANELSGLEMGWLWYYKNIDGNLGGNFTLVDSDSTYEDIHEGLRMCVHGKDITNDGLMDLVIGNYSGGVCIYLGDSSTVSVPELNAAAFDFFVYPNPSRGEFKVECLKFKVNTAYNLKFYNAFGELVFTSLLHTPNSAFNLQLPNGIYSCELSTQQFSKTKKIVIIK